MLREIRDVQPRSRENVILSEGVGLTAVRRIETLFDPYEHVAVHRIRTCVALAVYPSLHAAVDLQQPIDASNLEMDARSVGKADALERLQRDRVVQPEKLPASRQDSPDIDLV